MQLDTNMAVSHDLRALIGAGMANMQTMNGYAEPAQVDRKDTADKPLPLLMPYEALVAYSDISDVGNAKYGERDSWKNSTNGIVVYANAAARHLFKLLQGEEIDPETGLPHYKAVVWNAAAVAWHAENKKK